MDATRIITTYVLIDTATTFDHQTDVRTGVPDSEVVIVALVDQPFLIESLIACITRLDGTYA